MLRRAHPSATQSFDELADRLDAEPDLLIRVERMDGSIIEGRVVDVAQADILLLDANGNQVPVSASELRTVDAFRTRRVREWILALSVIPAVIALLVAFAQLPGIQALRHGVVAATGFVLIFTLGSALMAIPAVKNMIHSGVTHWQRLYSSTDRNQPS